MSDRNNGYGLDGAGLGSAVPRLPELDPPFDIIEPEVEACPVVFSSPHSGSIYPSAFLKTARLDPLTLRRSEDAFVDELFIPALSIGAPMLRARFPRAYLDVNREPFELDPRMFDGRLPSHANTRSIRVAGGLGTIARIVGEAQEIYWGRLPVAEAMLRIEALHRPYHAALKTLVERTRKRFGMAVLVDCHSMPSTNLPTENGGKADVVLGDRYGTSCDPGFVDCIDYELRLLGYRVLRNKPYAGGYITEYYGEPSMARHALQIEFNRGLYMDEARLVRSDNFDALSRDIAKVMERFAAFLAAGSSGAAAAE
ncbi:MAG TPA: N-formylglutamate amidohydrolase [Beijerinckiaceae bacterium]|jgi:N-formylglutamate amidohydrolase|nr:N-formylglutamate amidohydrolase [Beijerinckiaceae bacterium]